MPEYVLGGSELDGARIDAQLAFPAQIRKVLTQLRVGSPDNIDGRDVHVVQGNGSRGLVATLYFDKESGLLVRMVRFGTLTDRSRADCKSISPTTERFRVPASRCRSDGRSAG